MTTFSEVESMAMSPLSESETRFRTMADHAPVLLWMAGADGLCDFFNSGWLKFTGKRMEDEVGTGWAEGVHPEDLQRCMHIYLEALVARQPFAMEYRLRRHDGEYRWLYDQGAPRFNTRDEYVGYIGSCVDVTEQRQARDALKLLATELERQVEERTALAREREMLLREVHHRVKNDLQLVSSMLNMQQRHLADPQAYAALEECVNRVQTVALIHEHMYASNDVKQLSLSENVRSMAAGLFRLADFRPGPLQLELDVDDGIWLSVDRAIPCGLILNELLRNALKHAFPDGRQGAVLVRLKRAEGSRIVLTVADDGVSAGQEPNFAEQASFGWRLVDALVEQLGAALQLDMQRGLNVSITFDAGIALAQP